MAITPEQEVFCREYVASNLNATEAYAKAYPKAKRNSARANANRLLTKDAIRARIADLTAVAQKHSGITVEWALKRLKEEAEYKGEGSSQAARVSALRIAFEHLGILTEAAPHPDRDQPDLSKLTDDAFDRLGSILAPLLRPGDAPGV